MSVATAFSEIKSVVEPAFPYLPAVKSDFS